MSKLVMDLPELTEEQRCELRFLLADALDDFVHARAGGNARAYVDKRYPLPTCSTSYPEGPRREAKVDQVQRRIDLAKKLHNEALAFTIED